MYRIGSDPASVQLTTIEFYCENEPTWVIDSATATTGDSSFELDSEELIAHGISLAMLDGIPII